MQLIVHNNVVFRFNDGDFLGKPAVRGAFEKTWKGSNANVKKTCLYSTPALGRMASVTSE